MKFVLFIVLVFSTAALRAQSVDSLANDTTIYGDSIITVKPEFPGGTNELGRFLAQTIRYPGDAVDHNIQGIVIASFIVEKDGTLSNFKIVKSVSKSIDDETIRVLKLSPQWKPGIIKGKVVRTFYSNFPCSYSLG
ncbi:MAG: hypothetical protein JWR38_3340 [Mucilaginibacter sp.]|nr:hypothetical protein [Mucilaginibacter sp.]